jgi:solute carrier family 8 (sodium/calcium exchanger)
VALGTSLPDLFASRAAAMNEKYADNAIGNITGSNSVNVFLGLGLPWLIASIYHTSMVCVFLIHKIIHEVSIYFITSFVLLKISSRVDSSKWKQEVWDFL